MKIYVHRDGEQFGPYPAEDIRQFVAAGKFTASDLAWHKGAADWAPLSSIPDLLSQRASQPNKPAASSKPASTALRAISRDALGEYARGTLQADEQPLYSTTISPVILVQTGVVALVLLAALLPFPIKFGHEVSEALWLLLLIPPLLPLGALIAYKTSEFVITDQRVLIKVGSFHRQTLEMFVSKIESVAVNQDIFGRLWNYGTVIIRGTGGSGEPFKNISHPIEFRNCIQRVQSASESR